MFVKQEWMHVKKEAVLFRNISPFGFGGTIFT